MIPDLAISIINHSNPGMLRDCLRSIYSATRKIRFEIWVIDNATDQKLVPEIRAEFASVKWLFNSSRLGFSANHNQALAAAQGRYLCILNDDTILHDGALDELVAYMDANPATGMTGPRLLNRDGSIQNSTFRAKTLLGEMIGILQLPGGLNRLKLRGIDPAQFSDAAAKVDWLLGACIVIRRETLDQAGLLDDVLSPIANCEEVDWCDRVRRAGWSVDFVPTARVTHYGGQSLKSDSPGADRFRIEMHRVILGYFRKQRGVCSSLLLRAIYLLTLPWNGVMLWQSALRGRTDKTEARAVWATLLGTGLIALKPLRKPYCRLDQSFAAPGRGREIDPGDRAAHVPVST
jgi:GT2 family glycosyltransferase